MHGRWAFSLFCLCHCCPCHSSVVIRMVVVFRVSCSGKLLSLQGREIWRTSKDWLNERECPVEMCFSPLHQVALYVLSPRHLFSIFPWNSGPCHMLPTLKSHYFSNIPLFSLLALFTFLDIRPPCSSLIIHHPPNFSSNVTSFVIKRKITQNPRGRVE